MGHIEYIWYVHLSYRKINFARALSFHFAQLEAADTEKAEKQTERETKCWETNFYVSRLWPFLAPNKQDAAGSLVILVPPSLPPTCLPCSVIWIPPMWQEMERAEREGPRPSCTQRPPGICHIWYSQYSIQFLQKGAKSLKKESLNISWCCE